MVRAVPGSGKTWLVAELIRQELGNWSAKTSGIAALSFTRVGGDEIRKAAGRELNHPHFVGTLDAFLFRFVVRPFLQKCFPNLAVPRLIPGEWGAEHWTNYGRNQKATVGEGINLFGCVFIDEEGGKAVVAHKPHPARPLQRLDDEAEIVVDGKKIKLVKAVKDGKMLRWEQSGLLTHSDAALWASKILEHKTFGVSIRAELVRRFPLIMVDELQDTGYFLGKSIHLLLNDPAARGVLVGDPDQAIFEFNGARPDLFKGFEAIEGAVTLPLSKSQRCPPTIATVASYLRDSEGSIGGDHRKEGRAFLMRYGDMTADVPRVVDAVTTLHDGASVKVVARQTSTVQALIGRSGDEQLPRLGCPSLNHMDRAVVAFWQGRQVTALAAARSALELLLFKHEGVKDTELEQQGIEPTRWRRLAIDCLLRASAKDPMGNLYDWQTDVSKILDEQLGGFGLDESCGFAVGKLKPEKRAGWDKPCTDYLPRPNTSMTLSMIVPVQTVHGVKGETHDVTIFVCPDAKKAHYCPSAVWWSDDVKGREERRIAYVAMTRTQGDLIVLVSNNCYQRLCTTRKSFVESFECMTVSEYVSIAEQARRLERVAEQLMSTLRQPDVAERLRAAPGANEWSAAQIVGHMVEMIPYWLDHCRTLISAAEPPAFGRSPNASERLAGVEHGATGDPDELLSQLNNEVQSAAKIIRRMSAVESAVSAAFTFTEAR